MSTAFSRWFTRWMPLRHRPGRSRIYARPRFDCLEDRITPADMFHGGVRVATGDLTGDGVTDIIAAAGPGGGAHVRVLNGATGAEALSFMAYDTGFRGGVFVAAGDMDGNGTIDIVTGAGEGGLPHIKIFDGRTGVLQREFLGLDPKFTGGARVAVGDITGDGRADIVVGSGPGGNAPTVRVFSGVDLQQASEFTPFEGRFKFGVFVATGDTNGDDRQDIIVGSGGGKRATPQVKVFNGTNNSVLREFMAFDQGFTGGVSVASIPSADGMRDDILVGAGAGGVPLVNVFSGSSGEMTKSFMAYSAAFNGGVWVSNGNLENTNDIVTGAGPGGGPHVLGFHATSMALLANFYAFNPITGPFAGFGKDNDGPDPDPDPDADTVAPTVTVTTSQPANPVATNQTIQGIVADDKSGVATLTAAIDGGAESPVTFGANGNFTFTTALPLTGAADGSHTVVFRATDMKGNKSTAQSFTFTLETTTPELTLDLAPESDGAILGNHRTNDALVRLSGTAASGSTVILVGTNFTTTADAQGNYSFAQVPLQLGVNSFTARATNSQSQSSEVTRLVIRNSDPLAADAVENFNVAANAEATILNLPAVFSDIDVNSLVHFNTTSGEFDLELFDQQTPQTVKNFLTYISSGRYANSIFHRSVADFVVQGGGFEFEPNPSRLDAVTTDAPVQNEPALSNQLGTVAMAKLGGDPNSATSQFFFNLKDNSRVGAALDTQNGGFTAFGQLRGNGMQVVNQLAAIPVQNRGGVFSEIPLQNYPNPPAGNFPGDTTPANYAFVNSVTVLRDVDDRNGDALTFTVVSNSNPNLVSTDLVNGRLSLRYAAGQSGRSTLTIRATDTEGRSAESTFTVRVGTDVDDQIPPTLLIIDPASGETVNNNVTIQGTVTDDITGVFSLGVSVDGGPQIPVTFNANTGAFSFTTTLAVNGSQDGEHTLSFMARDIAGNDTTADNFTFTLDTTAPAISLTGPPSGQTTETNVTITGNATDALAGLDIVAVSVDGAAAVNATIGQNGNFSFTTDFDLDGSEDGDHSISFSARDTAGNLSGPVTFTMTLASPGSLTFDLDSESDTFGGGIAGNHRTILDKVGLRGLAAAGSTVTIVGRTEFTTNAELDGSFSFDKVPLELGVNNIRIRASLGTDINEFTRRIVRDSEPTIASPIANFAVGTGAAPSVFNLPAIFSDADVNSLVRFNTSEGAFDVELFDQFTPNTVKNFLGYLSRYSNTIFHRHTAGVLLQGGQFAFDVDNGQGSLIPIAADPTVPNEPGLSNQNGTIAMAPANSSPSNQQNQFFFNLGNNTTGTTNFDTANGGVSVFGVMRGNGAQVIGDITAFPVQDRGGDFSAIPLQNYPAPPAGDFPTDLTSANLALVNINGVRIVDPFNGDALTFTVGSNSNPNLVTPVISGGRLVLNYAAGQSGAATIVIRATDAEGQFIEASFTVTVG